MKKLAEQFAPKDYRPEEWVALAKEAGDFQTLQELKDRLRKSLEEQKQAQAAQTAKE
jgi:hypothetical protein